jgi:cytochrome c
MIRPLTLLISLIVAPLLASAATAQQTTLRAPDGTSLTQGVSVRVYAIDQPLNRIPILIEGQTPNASFIHPDFDLVNDDFTLEDEYFTTLEGYLLIETPGEYELRLISDDGSRLYMKGKAIIDNDGLHGPEPADGRISLPAGLHAYQALHFENGGGSVVRLHWRPPGETDFTPVPADHLYAPADEVRVTSPGSKKVILGQGFVRSGDGAPLDTVHPSYTMTPLASERFQPRVGGLALLPDGRLALATWDGEVFLLDHHDQTADELTIQPFASGLAEPLGITVVNGRLYVLQKQELTQLIDHDHDGVADEYRAIASGWPVSANFHEFAFGLVHHEDRFYFNLATAIDPGGASTNPQVYGRGTAVEVDPDTGEFRYYAGGLRTPNGIAVGPDDQLYITDNQGDWLPSSKLLRLREGAHYGNHAIPPGPFDDQPETPPVVWLPQGEIGNSPGQPLAIHEGPYAGQLLLTDVTHGGLKRVSLDPIDDVDQGTVFRFSQGLSAGTNRILRTPDGSLYVGGIGSGGNWGQTGKLRYGLDRLDPTGVTPFEMLAIHAMNNGLEINLTQPLGESTHLEPDSFELTRWWYEPTANYGGPKKDITPITIRSVTLSHDRSTIFLEVDDLREGHVYYTRWLGDPRSASGEALWTTEAWTTLNRIPANRLGVVDPEPSPHNQLTEAQRTEGWQLLFDGQTLNGWHAWGTDQPPRGWEIVNNALTRTGPGGDITTDRRFGNFELRLEWKVAPGGNSGIFYRAADEARPVWHTAPEMQVLDNTAHADGTNPLTSAGALYALIAPALDATYPPGRWNRVRLVVNGTRVQHHLNGQLLLETDLNSPEFRELVRTSKFAGFPDFARSPEGHIVLQDHGDRVAYRNIMIRELD